MGNAATKETNVVHQGILLSKVSINDDLTVTALLADGVDPNCVDTSKNTPLHVAAREGHVAVLKLLLNYKTDLHARNEEMETPLMCAASNGHATVLRLLLDKSNGDETLLNDQDDTGSTLLAMAVTEDHVAVIDVLLGYDGLLLDVADRSGKTALHRAVLYNKLQAFCMLLGAGADPWIHDLRQTTPLMSASIRGLSHMVNALLETATSAQVNAVNLESFTALHMAVRMDFPDIAEALVQCGAEVDMRDNTGLTAVMWAAQYGREQLTRLLLDAGCNPRSRDARGRNVLHHAAFFGWTDIVRRLLVHGVDPDVRGVSGNTPIILAVRNNHFAITKLLLDYNSDLSVPACLRGRFSTLLVLALQRGREDICKLLHKAGCTVTHQEVQQTLRDMHPIHPTGEIAQGWINETLNMPRSLHDSCRIVIRNSLGRTLRSLVPRLHLPIALQSDILLEDIPCKDESEENSFS